MIVASMYLLYKKSLETCLQTLGRLKTHLGETPEAKTLTYAGRLDPLASGLILALSEADLAQNPEIGHISELKQRLLDLPKTYEFEVVFGLGTDTFDQLGLICPSKEVLTWRTLNFDQETINLSSISESDDIFSSLANLKINLNNEVEMHYPFFSSKTIDGKSLFQITKELGTEKVNEILPKRNVMLYSVEGLGETKISAKDLANESFEIAKNMQGDFRQGEIIESWEKWVKSEVAAGDEDLRVIKFRITCGSGFYVRTFACWLGQQLGTGAIARNIFRTKVGDYGVEDAKEI